MRIVDVPRTIVTGGAGFIGSHLCERLISQGREVVCVDNLSTGGRANVQHLLAADNFKLLPHDVTDPLFLQADEVFNMACPASPVHYQTDPIHTMKTCVLGAINVLGLAKRSKARILQASTSEVYGDPQVHPQTEGYWGHVNPNGERSCYDEGKRAAETLFFDYRRQHDIEIKVCRIFNTYGPRMHPQDGRVVSNFIVQALRGEPLTIYGDGTQTRSFCYVDDLVDALLLLMKSDKSVVGPLNLGNPGEFQIIELAHMIGDMINAKVEIERRPLPTDDPSRRRPDISYAEQALGWTPKVSLKVGLRKTIDYFDDLLSGQVQDTAEPALDAVPADSGAQKIAALT